MAKINMELDPDCIWTQNSFDDSDYEISCFWDCSKFFNTYNEFRENGDGFDV